MNTSSLACAALPRLALLATGGTIAGAATRSTDTTDYQSASLGLPALLAAVPELAALAQIEGEQLANVDSSDVDQHLLLQLARRLQAQLDRPDIAGAVVTHGTDTLAESAFFIDLTLRSSKPVVFVGAMRPATAVSADGPMNLLQAVALAASADAAGRGTLIAFNDRIASAFYTSKTHSSALDTFRAPEQGFLGLFQGCQPHFYYQPALPVGRPRFDLQGLTELPKVSLLAVHQDMGCELIDAAVASGARGLVLEALGNGTLPRAVRQRVAELDAAGLPVVRCTRTGNGYVSDKPEGIAAGTYSAGKARWLLSLALASGMDTAALRALFLTGARPHQA
jgi:L-asparaginase